MNKVPLISMHKKYADLIKQGLKLKELRTWIPKNYKGLVYVVSTKSSGGSGKVEFSFWFDDYDEITLDDNLEICTNQISHEELLKQSCVDYNHLNNYFMNENGDVFGYAWYIKKLEIFDDPKHLSEFYKRIDGLDENGGFILGNLKDGEFVTIPELRKKYLLSKAPQKMVWVYVEDKE